MEFKHPKYYAELERIRKRWLKEQAASVKHQAVQDASSKPQAPSNKPQASSHKQLGP